MPKIGYWCVLKSKDTWLGSGVEPWIIAILSLKLKSFIKLKYAHNNHFIDRVLILFIIVNGYIDHRLSCFVSLTSEQTNEQKMHIRLVTRTLAYTKTDNKWRERERNVKKPTYISWVFSFFFAVIPFRWFFAFVGL